MEVKVYSSITDIPESKWDEIVERNHIIATHRFLEAVEKSNINDCKYFYPVVYDNKKIVAHACVYTITTDLDTLTSGLTKKIIVIIRLLWKNFLKIKFIECGTPIALGNTISFSENIDKESTLNLLADCIENLAKEMKVGIILLRDFYENETNFFDKLIIKKYKKVNNLPNTVMKVQWNSFDEYLNELKSHYRNEIKKNITIAKNNNLVIEVQNKFSDLSEQLQILWKNVYDNAKEYKREILTKEFFINMEKFLNEEAKVILLKKDLKIIGFALLISDNETLKFMYTGCDYFFNKECSIYFNSIYNVIKQAINEGKKEIDVGMSTYLPKINVGAKMVHLYMYMKHTNKLLNPIITNLFAAMNPKIAIKVKNIFKQKIENKVVKNYSMIHN